MKTLKNISLFLGILLTIGGIAGGIISIDTRYGKAIAVEANAREISKIKLKDRRDDIQQRVWTLEKDMGFDVSRYPEKYYKEYRQLQTDLSDIEKELEKLF